MNVRWPSFCPESEIEPFTLVKVHICVDDLNESGLFRFYNSEITKWIRSITMFILMSLAFLESPNSLTLSPDPRKINSDPKYNRPDLPHGLTESIELIILFIIGAMALLETWLVGIKSLKRKPWILFLLFSCLFSRVSISFFEDLIIFAMVS